jgi:hypothetical protein
MGAKTPSLLAMTGSKLLSSSYTLKHKKEKEKKGARL